MDEIEACLLHGRLKQGDRWVQFAFKQADLDNAFRLMQVNILNSFCDECEKMYAETRQTFLFGK